MNRTPPAWQVVVRADPMYHADTDGWALPGAVRVPFPAGCPQRTVALRRARSIIGRRVDVRSVAPDIDLAGPDGDPQVSPLHALLVPEADGGWSILDLRSAHGTYVNDGLNPISPDRTVPLRDGDQVHLGAWTTLTLRRTDGPPTAGPAS